MRLFGKRKDKILDLTKRYEKQQARAEEMRQDIQESQGSSENAGGFGFFGAIANTVSQNATGMTSENGGLNSNENSGLASNNGKSYLDISSGVDEKRRKLAKRLMEMTNKIEELSNQIYHLQQRIEVLEKRSGVGERFRGSE